MLIYTGVTLFCAVFGAVYECFANGVYTFFMLGGFLFPLALGFLPCLICVLTRPSVYPDTFVRTVWHSAVATVTVGSFYKGALVIYGTNNKWTLVYPIVGAALALSAIVICTVSLLGRKHKKRES